MKRKLSILDPIDIDPITIEVVNNALAAIAEEITINLARTAHNTIVYEVQDFCTGLLDGHGKLVAQAPGGLPLFVGDLDAAIGDGIEIHGAQGFDEGDVIMTNHTGTCGQHLNNVVVYTPIFFEGELVGFAATRAHWTDVGGRLAGGFLTDSVSSFEEGIWLRIHNKEITPEEAIGIKNIEQRTVALQEIGYSIVMQKLGAKLIDRHTESIIRGSAWDWVLKLEHLNYEKKIEYELVEIDMKDHDKPGRFIKVQWFTKEGILKETLIRVAPECKTAVEAIGWTFEDSEAYVNEVES